MYGRRIERRGRYLSLADSMTPGVGASDEYFGAGMGFTPSNDRFFVGSHRWPNFDSENGLGYLYTNNGDGTRRLDENYSANDVGAADHFGYWTAATDTWMVTSANGQDPSGNASGAAYVYCNGD